MKLADIAQKNDVELAELITKQKTALAEAAVEARTKEVRNVKTQYAIKRTIARALTIARQREIVAAENEVTNQEQTS
jgi:ribosomal protein L29